MRRVSISVAAALVAGLSPGLLSAAEHKVTPLDSCVAGQEVHFPSSSLVGKTTVAFTANGRYSTKGGGAGTWLFSEFTPDGKFGNLKMTGASGTKRMPVMVGEDGRCTIYFKEGDLQLGTVKK